MFGETSYNFEENISKIGKKEIDRMVPSSSTSRDLKVTIVTLTIE